MSADADSDSENSPSEQTIVLVTAKPESLKARLVALELTVAALAESLLEADQLLAGIGTDGAVQAKSRIRDALAPRVMVQMELFGDE